MAKKVLTYSPSDVKVILCGYELTGMVSVQIIWNAQPFKMYRGIRGINTRVLNRDLSATVQLEILQTSISNAILFQILRQDRNNTSARLDLTVRDQSGDTVLFTDKAYIREFPGVTFSDEFNNRVWNIDMLSAEDGHIGSNNIGPKEILDGVNIESYAEGIIA